jgi:hypothetical protein
VPSAGVTTGVDGGEANLIARQSDAGKELVHFSEAEDDGQLLLRRLFGSLTRPRTQPRMRTGPWLILRSLTGFG